MGNLRRPLWCQRCSKIIYKNDEWKISWFKNQEICIDCDAKENIIKAGLVKAGKNPADYEGCGYLPNV